jgi:hypothetical protein
MIGAVSNGHNGFGSAHRSMYPTWNETTGIQVLIAFLHNPKKSVHHKSCELEMSTMTVEGVAKGTGNETLSSSLCAVSSIILVHSVLNYLQGHLIQTENRVFSREHRSLPCSMKYSKISSERILTIKTTHTIT